MVQTPMQRVPEIYEKQPLKQIPAQECPWSLHGYLVRAKRARDTRAVPMGIFERASLSDVLHCGCRAPCPFRAQRGIVILAIWPNDDPGKICPVARISLQFARKIAHLCMQTGRVVQGRNYAELQKR